MPLNESINSGHVIIHELEQPHRYDYALNCSCGFQHHGFKADPKIGDATADMKYIARLHLANKHKVDPQKADTHIEVAPFTTPGGVPHDVLKIRLERHKATEAEKLNALGTLTVIKEDNTVIPLVPETEMKGAKPPASYPDQIGGEQPQQAMAQPQVATPPAEPVQGGITK